MHTTSTFCSLTHIQLYWALQLFWYQQHFNLSNTSWPQPVGCKCGELKGNHIGKPLYWRTTKQGIPRWWSNRDM